MDLCIDAELRRKAIKRFEQLQTVFFVIKDEQLLDYDIQSLFYLEQMVSRSATINSS